MSVVREANWRNDARAKVTGAIKYTDDLRFPNALHAVPVYSEFVHARLRRVVTERAEAFPGVVRVITAKDVPGSNHVGQIIRDFRIFADDKIRYNGDVVAVVVAVDRETAIKAAELVDVEADALPALLDPEEALKPNAVLVHEAHGSNIVNTHKVRRGDPEKAFPDCDLILEQDFQTQSIEHAYMEPEAAICVPRPDGVFEIYGSMQHPFSTRRFVAACLGMPLAQIEIVGTPMGGGFGGKDDTAAIVCARAALASHLTGRTVRMMYRRDWSIRESYKRHPYRVHYKMGLMNDGTIKAVACRIVADGGAYCSVTPWVTWRSTVQCCGPYTVEHVHCDTIGVYTNNVVAGAMRGFGSPQMNFVIEQMIDLAAERLTMSPIALRKKNMVRQGSVTITGQTLDQHTVAMEQVLDAVLKETGYEAKLADCARGGGESDEMYGIGLAMSYRGMSLGAEGVDFCAAIVNVQADGSILLEVGIHENGQGAESAMILVLARELGVEKEWIRYRRPSTSTIPDSGTTVASRATIMGGGAVVRAAEELKKKFGEVIGPKFGVQPQDLIFRDGMIMSADGNQSVTFNEAVTEMFQNQRFPHALGVFQAPRVTWDEHTGQGNAYFTWVYGCQAVELTVNRKSGKVTLLKAAAAHDVGRAVNRGMVLGQFYGGMAMGIGYALHEELKMEGGKILSLNLNTYRIPRANDIPEMTAIIIENNDPLSPSGAKGLGEPVNEIMAPAIANAIANATGRRFFRLPIKPGKQG
jgi:CO/xanthine dehydrogenase Mo-binding subunit